MRSSLDVDIFSEAGIKKLQEIKLAVENFAKINTTTKLNLLSSLQQLEINLEELGKTPILDLSKNCLEEIKEKELKKKDLEKNLGEFSNYSKNMVDSVVQICDLLIANPNAASWYHDVLLKELQIHTDVLDNNCGTFVLEVFNKESYSLAKLIYELTEQVDPKVFLNPSALKLINTVKQPLELFQILRQNLKANIDFYDLLLQTDVGMLDKEKEIDDYLGDFKNNYKKYIKGRKFQQLKEEYQELSKKFINDVNALPYLKIINHHLLINKDKPIIFGEVEIRGLAWDFIKTMLKLEIEINKLEANNEKITSIYKHFYDQFKFSECQKINEIFQNLTTLLLNEIDKYKKGGYIQGNKVSKFFKKTVVGVNPFKLKIVGNLEKSINENLKDYNTNKASLRVVAFDICRDIMQSISSNNNVAGAENLGLGQLSKILNEFKFKFLDLVLYQLKITNDPSLIREFNKYENELKLPVTKTDTKIITLDEDNNNISDNNNATTSTTVSPRNRR